MFKAGATRLVVLTPKYAIKIARIPIFTACFAFLLSLKRKFQSKSPLRFSRVGVHAKALRQQMFSFGIRANRAEAKYWQETHDEDCIPTTHVLLSGWIIIQYRGEAVKKEDVLQSPLAELMLTNPEFKTAKQFVRYLGRVVIADYASLGDPSLGATSPNLL